MWMKRLASLKLVNKNTTCSTFTLNGTRSGSRTKNGNRTNRLLYYAELFIPHQDLEWDQTHCFLLSRPIPCSCPIRITMQCESAIILTIQNWSHRIKLCDRILLSSPAKYAPILPNNSPFVIWIWLQLHNKNLQSGTEKGHDLNYWTGIPFQKWKQYELKQLIFVSITAVHISYLPRLPPRANLSFFACVTGHSHHTNSVRMLTILQIWSLHYTIHHYNNKTHKW